jgi:hypothetical protein
MQILGLGGVVAVAIDDHENAPCRGRGIWRPDARAHGAIVKQAIGERSDAILRTAIAGYDDFELMV